MAESDWETIEVPRGAFIGWSNTSSHAGKQHVTGEVLDYDPQGGTDFNDEKCPQLSVILTDKAASFNKEGERRDYEAGQLVLLNCGQVSLKRAVKAADLNVGDLVKITLSNFVKTDKGTVKEFEIKRKRGNGSLSSNAERALKAQQGNENGASAGSDPWESAPASAGASVGGGFDDSEPPF